MASNSNPYQTDDEPLHPYTHGVKGKKSLWQQRADTHQQAQKSNPFSDKWDGTSQRQTIHKDDPNYGRPVAGSKTEKRGLQAGERISNEIVELCEIIMQTGHRLEDGTYVIQFGPLFEFYTRISNKLVGMLLRARKHKLVEFKGEMLFQRRDDDVVIHLVDLPPQLLQSPTHHTENHVGHSDL